MTTTPELRQQVLNRVYALDVAGLRSLLDDQHPADIADLLESLDEQQRVWIFSQLQLPVAAEVLDEARTDTLLDLVEGTPDERIADLLEEMPMDDAAEILSEIKPARADELIALMEPEEAAEVGQLLAYPPESAGRLMNADIVRLQSTWTVAHTLDVLREVDPEIELLAYLYVVDPAGKLEGVVPLRRLITARPERVMSDLTLPSVVTVQTGTDQEEVARVMAQYDFFAVPVTDEAGVLAGIVTHDDVIDVLADEFTEDVQRFGGSAPLENSYLSTPVGKMVRKRVGWLFLLFFTAQLTTTIMQLFADEINQVVALSFFVPLLIGTGGNAGSQMTATMIRAVAVGEVRFSDIWTVLSRELATGLLLGLAMGAAGFVFAQIGGYDPLLAITVALALLVLVVWANLMGVLLPIFADRLNVDPTVISGPVMSTLVDATGLLIYFTLAGIILGL
ncbi:MAG: magnesium transporter [Chloroflexi bacterium]|nr:magnesium transporter [Chloroflexota bacterium]